MFLNTVFMRKIVLHIYDTQTSLNNQLDLFAMRVNNE